MHAVMYLIYVYLIDIGLIYSMCTVHLQTLPGCGDRSPLCIHEVPLIYWSNMQQDISVLCQSILSLPFPSLQMIRYFFFLFSPFFYSSGIFFQEQMVRFVIWMEPIMPWCRKAFILHIYIYFFFFIARSASSSSLLFLNTFCHFFSVTNNLWNVPHCIFLFRFSFVSPFWPSSPSPPPKNRMSLIESIITMIATCCPSLFSSCRFLLKSIQAPPGHLSQPFVSSHPHFPLSLSLSAAVLHSPHYNRRCHQRYGRDASRHRTGV